MVLDASADASSDDIIYPDVEETRLDTGLLSYKLSPDPIPTNQTIDDLDSLTLNLKLSHRTNGYCLVGGRTRKVKATNDTRRHPHVNKIESRTLVCKCSGTPDLKPDAQRRHNTFRMGCQYELELKWNWKENKWNLKIINDHHCHPPVIPSTYPDNRLLDVTPAQQAKAVNSVLTTPREMASEFNGEGSMFLEDNYEFRADFKNVDGVKTLNRLVFTSKYQIETTKQFSSLMTMDGTCLTNGHGFTCINLVGINGSGKTFISAMAFLSNTTQEDYEWLLSSYKELLGGDISFNVFATDKEGAAYNAVCKIFPNAIHILCRWHFKMNIIAQLTTKDRPGFVNIDKDSFEVKEILNKIYQIIDAETEDECRGHLKDFKEGNAPAGFIDYMLRTWFKESSQPHLNLLAKVCRYSRNHLFHLEIDTTQITEQAHAHIKKGLRSDMDNLYSSIKGIHKMLIKTEGDLKRIDGENTVKQVGTILTKEMVHFFEEIRNRASMYIIQILCEDLKCVKSNWFEKSVVVPPCSGYTRRVFGRPCKHDLLLLLQTSSAIQCQDLHIHWLNQETRTYLAEGIPIPQRHSLPPIRSKKRKDKTLEGSNPQVKKKATLKPQKKKAGKCGWNGDTVAVANSQEAARLEEAAAHKAALKASQDKVKPNNSSVPTFYPRDSSQLHSNPPNFGPPTFYYPSQQQQSHQQHHQYASSSSHVHPNQYQMNHTSSQYHYNQHQHQYLSNSQMYPPFNNYHLEASSQMANHNQFHTDEDGIYYPNNTQELAAIGREMREDERMRWA